MPHRMQYLHLQAPNRPFITLLFSLHDNLRYLGQTTSR